MRAVGARKILGHGNACRLEEISFKKLEAEMAAKPEKPAPKKDDADEDGGESEDE